MVFNLSGLRCAECVPQGASPLPWHSPWGTWSQVPLCDWHPSSAVREVRGRAECSLLCPQCPAWAGPWRKACGSRPSLKTQAHYSLAHNIKLIAWCFSASEPVPQEPVPFFPIQKMQIDEREEFGPQLPPVFCPSESRALCVTRSHWTRFSPEMWQR